MAKFGVVFYKMCGKLKAATSTTKYFYELNLSSNLKDNYSFEETLAELCEINNVSDLNLTRHSILEGEVTEESYNNLVDYVLEQVNLEGANVLNVTKFASVLDGSGKNHSNFTVELNGIIYNVQAKTSSFSGNQEGTSIICLTAAPMRFRLQVKKSFFLLKQLAKRKNILTVLTLQTAFAKQLMANKNTRFYILKSG